MKILHIDSSIAQERSVTRLLSHEVVRQMTETGRYESVVYRDVVKDEIRHLTGNIAAGFRPVPGGDSTGEALTQEHQISDKLIEEFLASDTIVIGAPMYNFSVPSQLKAWLDRLAQPGKTFSYTPQGPVGLAGGKTVIVVSARGGFYANTPLVEMDFQERYLRNFFAFLGISHVEFIRAEGTSKGDEIKQHEIADALVSIPHFLSNIYPS